MVSSVRAAASPLRLLLRRRRVALEGRRAHRAAQRGELPHVLVPRAPQHPDLSLELRVRVGERAHVLARLGRVALDLGDAHRALLRGGAQRRRQLLELFHAALFDLELLREALALAAHLVEARLQ